MAAYYPGRVATTAMHVARHGNAAPWDWLRSGALRYDLDITSSYHETICAQLLHCIHGINTTVVLWGDQYWLASVANGEVYHIVDRCVAFLRSPERDISLASPLKIYKMVFLSQSFDTATGALHDIVRRELLSADTGTLRNVLPASDPRTIILVKLAMLINDFEVVVSIVIPPPLDNATWDVHAYLRGMDEAVLSTNALKTIVLHCGSAQPPGDEVRTTLQRLQQRVSAPIPNTEAARHLLGVLNAQAQRPPPAPGHTEWGKQRADEVMADLQAMEGELVAVRAAFVAANERAMSLEQALTGATGRADGVKPVLLDPAAVQRENLRVSEELLRRINIDYADLGRRVAALERGINTPADTKLRLLLNWRQQEAETLLLRMAEAPMLVVSGGHTSGVGNLTAMRLHGAIQAAANQGVALSSPSPAGGAGKPLEPQAVSVGTKVSIDPLTLLYQSRLIELENEVAKMVDVDVKACVDDYFVRELDRMEKELVQWITRCRTAEEQKLAFEQALKSR